MSVLKCRVSASLVGNVRYWLSFQKISSGQDWSPSRQ
jgi:hypothetical protein